MGRWSRALTAFMFLLTGWGCQSPTSASSTTNVDTYVDATISPNPATAIPDTDGKTYRVVRGNNQPDDVLPYQYITTFSITVTLNGNATSKDVALTFPVTVTSAAGKVEQAQGGIVTPPTGGDVEHYESILLSSSTSTISQVGGGAQMVFEVWYTLPDKGKEALVTETISMKDNSDTPKTFDKVVHVKVAP
jgi:hypothetical protein